MVVHRTQTIRAAMLILAPEDTVLQPFNIDAALTRRCGMPTLVPGKGA